MVGWHWGFHGLEFQQALGVGDGPDRSLSSPPQITPTTPKGKDPSIEAPSIHGPSYLLATCRTQLYPRWLRGLGCSERQFLHLLHGDLRQTL